MFEIKESRKEHVEGGGFTWLKITLLTASSLPLPLSARPSLTIPPVLPVPLLVAAFVSGNLWVGAKDGGVNLCENS